MPAEMLLGRTDSDRESTESWEDLPRDCRRRGMRAPALAVSDGGSGRRCGRLSPRPESNAAGSTSKRMFLPRSRSPRIRERGGDEGYLHHQPHRIHLRDRAVADEGHRGAGIACGGDGDGLQADRGRPVPMEGRQRPTPGGTRPGLHLVPQGQAPRTPHRHHPGNRHWTRQCLASPDRVFIPTGIRQTGVHPGAEILQERIAR